MKLIDCLGIVLLLIIWLYSWYLIYELGKANGELKEDKDVEKDFNDLILITEKALKLNDELINTNKELIKINDELMGEINGKI